jgi:heat shock protein HslJ
MHMKHPPRRRNRGLPTEHGSTPAATSAGKLVLAVCFLAPLPVVAGNAAQVSAEEIREPGVFDHREGAAHEVRVGVTPVANPPADASSRHYRLVETVSRQPETLSLEHTLWRLRALRRGGGAAPVPPGEGAAIDARFEDGKVAGNGGCNRYLAAYKRDGAKLQIRAGAGTLMACPEPAMSLERDYHAALTATAGFRIEDRRLLLVDEQGDIVLELEADRPAALTDADWHLLGYNTGNALVSNRATETMTARFGSDGKIAGFGGCNRYFGSYEAEGERLRIGPLASSRKLCLEPQGVMQDEAGFLKVLEQVTEYRIEGRRLTLLGPDGKRLAICRR